MNDSNRLPNDSGKVLAAAGLFLFLLNAFLLPVHLGWQDSGEFLATTACLGISHPSGQPLYNLLGAWFLALPFGTPAWRLGLMSAAASAFAAVVLMVLVRRMTKIPMGWIVPLCVGWALTWPWWDQAVTVETYALGTLQALLVLWALSQEEPRRTALAGLTLGLVGVYRPTYILGLFVSVPMLLWVWPRGERLRRAVWFTAFWGMGISLPIYLAVRSHALAPVMYADLSHFEALAKHVLGLTYSKHLGASGSVGAFAMAGRYLAVCWKDLTPVGLLLVAAGLGFLARSWKRQPIFLRAGIIWAALDLGLLLTVPYPTLETHQVLWPWVVSAFLVAVALEVVWEKRPCGMGKRWVPVLLVLLALVQGLNIDELLRKRNDRTAEDYANDLLSILPKRALYYASSDNDYFPVIGMQQGYGIRPDVTVLSPGNPRPGEDEWVPRQIRFGSPVVAARLAPGLFKGLVPIPLGPLWLYAREPACRVEPVGPQAPLAVWPVLELSDFKTDVPRVRRGGVLTFQYAWHRPVGKTPPGSLQVLVLLVDDKGGYPMADGGLWLHDTHDCLNGWYVLSTLDTRKTYRYERKVFVPSNFPAGTYRVIAALQPAVPPKEGVQEAGGEFYGDGSWQAAWQFGGRGTWGGVQRMTAGKGENQLMPIVGGYAPKMLERFAVVGEVSIQE